MVSTQLNPKAQEAWPATKGAVQCKKTQRHKILGNVPNDCLIGNTLDFLITRSECKLQSKGNTSETLDIHYESSTMP